MMTLIAMLVLPGWSGSGFMVLFSSVTANEHPEPRDLAAAMVF